MKVKYLITAAVIVWVAILVNAVAAEQAQCPEGSYSIGEGKLDGEVICKLNPTGCPYGDSIPLGPDCDKHANDQANKPQEENTNISQGSNIASDPLPDSSTVEDYSWGK